MIQAGTMSTLVQQTLQRGSGRFLTYGLGRRIGQRTSVTATAASVTDHHEAMLASAKPFSEVPKIRTFPVVGSSWIFFPIIGKYSLSKSHIADREKYRIYGDIVRDKFGSLDLVSVYRPEDMEAIFRNEGKYPSRGEFTTLKAYRESRKKWYNTTGIMVLQGKEWYDLRSKTQPHLMKPKLIESYIGAMQAVALDLVGKMKDIRDQNNEVPNFLDELYKWSLESIAFVGLDTRLGCLDRNLSPDSDGLKMIKAVQITFDCMNKLEAFTGNFPFWKYFPTPTWNKFVKAMDVFSEIAHKHVTRTLNEIKGNIDEDKELTVLQALLCTKGLDVSGAMTTVIDMLMAGIDTTSHTVGFLLYHLAKNQDKQQKLYDEVTRLLPSKSDKFSPAYLNESRYLKSCIKEAIRLDPIVRGNARMLQSDMVLNGYRIPAGVIVFGIFQVACRLEKNFQNANQFIPERWLDKEKKFHPFLYTPFGFGPRSCIGRRLAELEMMSLVTEIVRNFKVEYHHEDIDMNTRMVNIPDRPLRFNFIDRT